VLYSVSCGSVECRPIDRIRMIWTIAGKSEPIPKEKNSFKVSGESTRL